MQVLNMRKYDVSIFVPVAMMMLMVFVFYVPDARWIWSIVAVAFFAVICVGCIVHEASEASGES